MNEGLELGHEMAKVAADNAGENWKKVAYEAFVRHAKNNKFFATENVQNNELDVSPPPDRRAWGQIALQAQRQGVVSADSLVRSSSKICHGRIITIWKSNIYGK